MNKNNFFSSYIKLHKSSASKVFGTIVMLLLIISILSSFSVYNFLEIRKLKDEQASLAKYTHSQEFMKNKRAISEATNRLASKQEYYGRIQGIARNIEEIDIVSTRLLNAISGALPEGISFEVLSLDAEQFQLMAVSNSRIEIAEFQYNLLMLGIFNDIHIANISGEGEEDTRIFTFALSATLNGEELR
ncbi:MAG: PilN domain-containing protein [Alkaliphilus sp.]